jgi:DNA-binding XRE family transcriptional regulator
MMTDEQRSKVQELKAQIAATAATPSGAPAEVRAAVVVLKRELRRAGTTARALASALGLHETTLCRWERESRTTRRKSARAKKQLETGARTKGPRATGARASGFRVVQLAAPETGSARSGASQIALPSSSRGLRVAHAPSGLVVDGLDVETLAALLQRLS